MRTFQIRLYRLILYVSEPKGTRNKKGLVIVDATTRPVEKTTIRLKRKASTPKKLESKDSRSNVKFKLKLTILLQLLSSHCKGSFME